MVPDTYLSHDPKAIERSIHIGSRFGGIEASVVAFVGAFKMSFEVVLAGCHPATHSFHTR